MTPCGEGRVTTRSCEGLAQAGSTFPGRKRIVKSNTESNRVESEGPESAVLHIVAHGRAVRKRRAWQRENAGCWPLHLAYMYVLCQRAFCIRAVATSSPSSFSLSASFPAGHSFRPPFLRATCTARLFFSLNPVPSSSSLSPAFRLFYLFFGSTRASRIASRDGETVSTNSEKRNARTEKGEPRGESALQYSVGMLNRSLVEINNRLESHAERNIKQRRVQAPIVARR